MGILKEFKEFALRGNVIDLAVGVVIGGAFNKIIGSMVNDVIMPVISLLIKFDFSQFFIPLASAPEGTTLKTLADYKAANLPTMPLGSFVQAVIDFVIMAFAIFMMIKVMNSLSKKKEEAPAAPAAPPEDIVLLRQIRDSLKR